MKRILTLTSVAVILLAGVLAAQVARTKSPDTAKAYIIAPKNGATVAKTFTVQFGLKGMGIAPVGVNSPNTGHHHLLIDEATMPDLTMPLPANDHIRHFGGGQTEVELTLPSGKHTLQLVLGDYMHTPHDKPVVSEKIAVTVK